MDYKKAAQQVLDNIGGASNIVSPHTAQPACAW